MASYFTDVSFAFDATPEQAEQLDVAFKADGQNYLENYPACLSSIWPTAQDFYRDLTGEPSSDALVFGIERDFYDNGQYIVHGSNANVEAIGKVIQPICKPETPIVIHYAFSASKPVLDAFGGGVCVIFADKIVCKTTQSVAEEIINQNT